MLNLDFLNIQPPRQENSSEFTPKADARQDTSSVKERAQFGTQRAKTTDTQETKQTDFAKFIQFFRPQETAKVDVAPISDQALPVQQIKTEETIADDLFFTAAADIQSEPQDDAPSDDMLSKIVALNAEIKALLDTMKDAAPKVSKQEISVDGADITEESTPAVIELLGLILSLKNPGQTDSEISDQLLKLVNTDEQLPADVKVILAAIESIFRDGNSALTQNFTAEEIADIRQAIQKVANGETLEQEEIALIEELVSQAVILKPAFAEDVAVQAPALIIIKTDHDNKSKTTPVQDINTQQAKSELKQALPEKHFAQARYDARYDAASTQAQTETDAPAQDFKVALKDADQAFSNGKSGMMTQQGAQNLMSSAGLSRLENALTQTLGTQAAAQTTTQSVQTALTNVVTQNSSAGVPHPATQMVAATIHKAVKGGESTTIRLQLDPPELGRVEVKMSIDKDAKTKIVLTAEKPETLHLLQKDAQVLDRALQSAGLDTEGSLSFELASQQQDSGNGNQRGGGHDRGGKGASDETDINVIETVMNWHIDPQTGAMRYNALV